MINKKKSKLIISEILSKIYIIIGILLSINMSIFVIVGAFSNSIEGTLLIRLFVELLFIIALAFSVLITIKGFKIRKLNKLFKQYATLLSRDSEHSIDNLAATLNKPIKMVKQNLCLMIEKKYFQNVFLDFNKNCLILQSENNNQKMASNNCVAVNCVSCGASNIIPKNSVTRCEYCGSYLQTN